MAKISEEGKAAIPSEKGDSSEKCCSVDRDLAAFKMHYFLLSAAHVGVIPYLPIYAKTTLGCSATTVGILATCMQFSTSISKPLFGLLADYLNQMKILIASLLAFEVLLSLLMLALPPIAQSNVTSTVTSKSQEHKLLRLAPARIYDPSVGYHVHPMSFEDQLHSFLDLLFSRKDNYAKEENFVSQKNKKEENRSQTLHQSLSYKDLNCQINCNQFSGNVMCYKVPSCSTKIKSTNVLNCTLKRREDVKSCEGFIANSNFTISYQTNNCLRVENTSNIVQLITYSSAFDKKFNQNNGLPCNISSKKCTMRCSEFYVSSDSQTSSTSIYKTYQFWAFCIFALLGAMCQAAVYTLSDTICYEHLRGTTANFGRQRLWGSIGWGVIAPITGYVDDLITGPAICEDYSSGWYMMAVLSFCFLVNLYCLKIPKSKKRPNVCKSVKEVIFSKHFLLIEINVFLIGILTAYPSNYVMWYMESLGSTNVQMGLALAVACVFGNAPLMYFSGFLISKLGHWNVINVTFLAFAIRFGAYYILTDPWTILPIELLDGITFGLFYTTITSYSELISIPGTEATIQGILGGTYQGLGSSVGCLLAGLSFDRFGGRRSFLLVSIVSVFLAISQTFLYLICRPQKTTLKDTEDYVKV